MREGGREGGNFWFIEVLTHLKILYKDEVMMDLSVSDHFPHSGLNFSSLTAFSATGLESLFFFLATLILILNRCNSASLARATRAGQLSTCITNPSSGISSAVVAIIASLKVLLFSSSMIFVTVKLLSANKHKLLLAPNYIS